MPQKEDICHIVEANHEGAYGGHFALKIILRKIFLEGYVWPSIQRDANH